MDNKNFFESNTDIIIKKIVLSEYLSKTNIEHLTSDDYFGHCVFKVKDDNDYYIVLSDDEADNLAELLIKKYISEEVVSKIPFDYEEFFDVDACYEEMLWCNGRESYIDIYDEENSITFDNNTYYIYRISL